jgi:Spy/CpxP family protein refolding chaperone
MTVRTSLLRSGALLGLLMTLLAMPAVAQPPGGGQGRGGFGGGRGGGFGGGMLMLLGNEDVKKELQLLDDQTEKLAKVQEDMGAEMRDIFQSGDRESMAAKMAEMRKKGEEEIAKVLDTDQMKRLKQIEFQQSINAGMGGFASGIISDPIVEQLGLSKEQVEQLTEAQKAADEELRKKQAALRAEALEKLVASMSPEQQTKFKELYGKHFEMRFNFGGGGRGAGGGQGGGGRGNRQRPGGDRDLN